MIVETLMLVLALAPAPPATMERESFEIWLCPMHRDQQSTGSDRCPVCGMEMVQRFLVASYSCPMHTQVDEQEEGSCPVCGMALVPMNRELQWYCADDPRETSSVAGICSPSGRPMDVRAIPMAHGDHNPKHGGILFMAPNGFHHLEGTLDDAGEFRLYVYDDFTKPIDAREVEARVDSGPMDAATDGTYLTARLTAPESFPAEVVAHVRLPDTGEDEARFDFSFPDPRSAAADSDGTLALPEFHVPDDPAAIFAEILSRDERVRDLIARGAWTDLYIPALEAKDLALALSENALPGVELATRRLVRAAWLLDTYGDRGNRLEVQEAYLLFERAVRELESSYAP